MRVIIVVVCLASVSCTSPYPNAIPAVADVSSLIPDDQEPEKGSYLYTANKVKDYEQSLADKQNKLATQKYALSDVSAAGAVTSVIAAASGSLTTALYAGGIAVAGGVAGQRYNYDAQILNYHTTRQKLNCIYRAMTDISTQQLTVAMDDKSNPSVIQTVSPYLRGVISEIAFELESQQSAVNLIAPDLKSISGILTEQQSALIALRKIKKNNFLTSSDTVPSLAELIRTNIKMCTIFPTTAPVVAVNPEDEKTPSDTSTQDDKSHDRK